MNEWLSKFLEQLKGLWAKWTLMQKLVLAGIVVAAIVVVIALFAVSSAPTMVPIIDAPIRDEIARDRILTRLNEEGVKTSVDAAGVVMVSDEATAKRMRSILIREDLVPQGTDPWALFDRERWTLTDFERNVNLRRSITAMVIEHVKALDDIDDANVTLVMPENQLFQADQNPVTASVIVTPRPGSDLTQNRKKIEGIQKILKFAVEGLTDENIVITDQNGMILNDFAGMQDFDRLELSKREQKHIASLEAQYRASVLKALQQIYTSDRVRDLNVKINMDMSKKAIQTEEFYPIELKADNPDTPYDDSQFAESITRSQSNSSTKWEGTGFNPEGPAGVEGQTAPAFKDMSNLYGKVEQSTLTQNEEINKRAIQEERSPTIERVSVSVNIDGKWKVKFDKKGEPLVLPDGTLDREYIPVPDAEIKQAQALVQDSVGFDRKRGDSVTVQNIQFDRTKQFSDEDAAFLRRRQFQVTLLLGLAGLAVLLIAFIMFRVVSRELERRRRLKEEELSRQHQMLRESALRQAEEEGVEVSMSVEERKRMELQENAINMAKEHPEDVAQLIRTWLLEE
ncbi:MAG: flagellar M-ring protein FliF [Treponema sp. GWB1_62_6]|nr:MAG: flagellar M-ring protein FliF [Treponema sp. GWC1_61_84]OHE67127.1 MAG: flagellar M-ring protein FliF [Treponema sp. GWB1_62_6]HCM25239.1 flagellar M-ring protein FliF [Treponema sp.]